MVFPRRGAGWAGWPASAVAAGRVFLAAGGSASSRLRARSGGVEPSPATVTTGQWLQLWLDTRIGPGRSTLQSYRQHVRTYLIPHLGRTLLSELKQARVQEMFTALIRTHGVTGRPLSPGTLQRIHATFRAALNAAVRRGLLKRNPARFVELPSGRRPHAVVWTAPRVAQWRALGVRPRVAVWTAEQTAAFLREIGDHRFYPLFHLVALLGLQRGEVIGLRWSDLDLDTGYLTVSPDSTDWCLSRGRGTEERGEQPSDRVGPQYGDGVAPLP
jgi:integrase